MTGALRSGEWLTAARARRVAIACLALAIASLVCSVVGFFLCGVPAILGIIFGGVALGQTKDNARPGRGLAIAGLIVGILVVVMWAALWIAAANHDGGCIYFGRRPSNC